MIIKNYFHKIIKNIDEIKGKKIKIIGFRLVVIKSNLFIEIISFEKINEKSFSIKSENNKKIIKVENEFFFTKSKFIKSFSELKSNNLRLFSIYLEYKYDNIFEDIDGNSIKIKTTKKFERYSKYYFSNLYISSLGSIEYIPLTTHCNINVPKLLDLIEDNQITSGIISEILVYENKINTIINNKNSQILLNNKLIILDDEKNNKQNNDKIINSTIAFLFLIFHEKCGHMKSNISNFEDKHDQF